MPIDLEELEPLLAEATPGPWRGDREDGSAKYYLLGPNHPDIPDPDGWDFICKFAHDEGPDTHDSLLIVAAVNTLPDLIREMRELRADRERLDWLERNADGLAYFRRGSDDYELELSHSDGQRLKDCDLRAAIDAARGHAEQGGADD